MKKRQLEMILERVDSFEKPKERLEQYRTPPSIAAAVLYQAALEGNISGKRVVDLGCGAGMLSIGAMVMGAREVLGVEIDPDVLPVLHRNLSALDADGCVLVQNLDVSDLQVETRYHTCLMNPPFGSQNKKADRPFLEKAIQIAGVVYSFHMSNSESFVEKFVEARGASVLWKKRFKFVIPRMFSFHTKDRAIVEVTCFKFQVV